MIDITYNTQCDFVIFNHLVSKNFLKDHIMVEIAAPI